MIAFYILLRGIMNSKSFPVIALTSFLSIQGAEALSWRVPDTGTDAAPGKHIRFVNFSTATPTRNTGFLHAGVDTTGVGYFPNVIQDPACTMISPKHYLQANHFNEITVGQLARFVTAGNVVVEGTVGERHNLTNSSGGITDLLVGELVTRIPESSGIVCHPYLNDQSSYTTSPNNQLIVLGRRAGGGVGTADQRGITEIFGQDNSVILFSYYNTPATSPIPTTNDDVFFNVGDSGGPSLVEVRGRGAVVGIHSGVGTDTTNDRRVNFDLFVPDASNVAQINAILAQDGYHLTEAFPDSGTPQLSVTAPTGVLRAGYPIDFTYTVTNPERSVDLNNIRIQHPVDLGTTSSVTSNTPGTIWVDTSEPTLFDARLGGLEERGFGNNSNISSSTVTSSVSFANGGTFTIPISLYCDENFSVQGDGTHAPVAVTESVTITLLESFVSYVAGNANETFSGDDDSDGLSNLVEYAFGGDLGTAEHVQPGSAQSLLPVASEPDSSGTVQYSFLRRTDAAARGLSYTVQESDTLVSIDWGDVTLSGEQTTDLGNGFESVVAVFNPSATQNFYRVKVELNE